MGNLSSNDPIIILIVTTITSLTTIVVTWLGKRVSQRMRTRVPRDFSGYERLIKYVESELQKKDKDIEDLRNMLDVLRVQLTAERASNQRMRDKLLDVSRQYGVDVSGVIQ